MCERGSDGQALDLSQQAVAQGWLAAEPDPLRRQFWLMPQMHAENLAVQEAALPLFQQYTDARTAEFAQRHRDVIARFGRFPHRNAALARNNFPPRHRSLPGRMPAAVQTRRWPSAPRRNTASSP